MERLSRDQIKSVVLSGDEDVRRQFASKFDHDIEKFIDHVTLVFDRLANIEGRLPKNEHCAWVLMFLFSAANNLLVSFHLLINGFLLPSGNLMRSWVEAVAMALLCSNQHTGVYEHFIKNPDTFSIQKAPNLIRRKKIAEKLGINREGWENLIKIMDLFNKYSHASAFSFASYLRLGDHGGLVVGGDYDSAKETAYSKEILLRISACEQQIEVTEDVGKQIFKIDD